MLMAFFMYGIVCDLRICELQEPDISARIIERMRRSDIVFPYYE